ncbi:4Fe-4S single cluster domain-containing protein [Butyrivibrio sp.]|jgi:anaerobic ribonucleoside-triphosphate reductase activating protein|uniref:4Fe-4S single cluster domain-containing protein n=1 Tax=Butyrivibrio sp. TaxID=28121 RepID=UPI0025C4595C|nr:4Fe-4S single cluster domain-containing protein [Butyrivibrio sp.]MBE5837974.1 4Fe-4S cluster-binding domain-containing protein [Butyrivibrio sp.]
MYVARILYPVKVLGPGLRIGIWFAGCRHHCDGCSNPELWEFNEKYSTSLEGIMKLIMSIAATKPVDGFTLTGGDPIEQGEELLELLNKISDISDDILLYTGFEYEEVVKRFPEILNKVSVIIDGKYIEAENYGDILIGSRNQKIIILDNSKTEKYDNYIKLSENSIQNFFIDNSTISVGIHKPGFEEELNQVLERKGLRHG